MGRLDLDSYDKIVIYFSGGKDSLAGFLNLLALGMDPETHLAPPVWQGRQS